MISATGDPRPAAKALDRRIPAEFLWVLHPRGFLLSGVVLFAGLQLVEMK
jgi:hypothetical protein